MTYQELVTHIRRLPLQERLELLNVLIRSLQDELAPHAQVVSSLERIRGIAKPEGPPPTDEQIEEDYTNYLMEKYL